jgi:bifunctional non-homologous end joining protein LigD
VSIPITWDELTEPDLRAAHWDLHAALDRVRTTGDPLVPLIRRQQTLRPL